MQFVPKAVELWGKNKTIIKSKRKKIVQKSFMMKIDEGSGEFSEFVIRFWFFLKRGAKTTNRRIAGAERRIIEKGMNSGKRLSPNL